MNDGGEGEGEGFDGIYKKLEAGVECGAHTWIHLDVGNGRRHIKSVAEVLQGHVERNMDQVLFTGSERVRELKE